MTNLQEIGFKQAGEIKKGVEKTVKPNWKVFSGTNWVSLLLFEANPFHNNLFMVSFDMFTQG